MISKFQVNPLWRTIFTIPERSMILAWNLDQYLNLTNEIRRDQKNLMMTLCQKVVVSLIFFQFMANLEQSWSQIPDTWSVKLPFLLTVTFYLKKSENRTKKTSNTALILLLWVMLLFLIKYRNFLQKIDTITKFLKKFALKSIFFETT